MDIEVSCGFGTETATKIELKRLGVDAPNNGGRFCFDGDGELVAECNLRLRTADRVYVRVAEFPAATFDELFDGIFRVEWQDLIFSDQKIIVNAKSVNSALFALSALQSVAKKAIVKKCSGTYLSLPETGAPFYVELRLVNNVVRVLIDTSGDGLHKRGYRKLVADAPLKETIAASILELSVWNPDRAFVDAFCGSGTFPVEAAMRGLNMAPGLYRGFALENYKFLDCDMSASKRRAQEEIDFDRKLRISGFDIDKRAIKIASASACAFGLEKYIHLETADMRTVKSRYKYGVLMSNPPYGERIGDRKELPTLHRDLGNMFRSLDDWSAYILTAGKDFEKQFGMRANKKRKLFNSNLECCLYQFLGAAPDGARRKNGGNPEETGEATEDNGEK